MLPPDPSADPNRTLDHQPIEAAPESDTVDVSKEASTGATNPYTPCTAIDPLHRLSIPGYRITGEIAKGGMGEVYAAVDLTLDREVAIKTLLAGANSERFVTEAKITARLPHPGIPPVHALGTLPEGTPWLAMKRIRGQTLAILLKDRSSPQEDVPRYIQIFEQIAQAVGFAHSRGVIHRDLKPLNVMVGEFGEVQVMDWGLAKDHQSRERERPADPDEDANDDLCLTADGVIMGTPGYMAPEQARGEVVDARADVFALGSLLAAILTGQPAFVGTSKLETIQKAAAAALMDVLARLDACGADDDLVSLTKRCLAAERDSRPADAREVAAEVAAYRAGVEQRLRQAETEAAEARVREVEQRKRRRTLQWAGGLIAVVLGAGIVGTSLGLMAALRQTDVAQEQEAEAKRQAEIAQSETAAKEAALQAEAAAREDAEAKRQEAERNLEYARKGNGILGSVFAGLDPKTIAESDRPLQDVLRQNLVTAVNELEGSALGDPLEVATMQNTLGRSLLGLGEATLAIEVFAKARATRESQLGPDHPDTLTSMGNLALGYQAAGQLDLALPLLEETLRLEQATLGPDHPETLTSMGNLAFGYKDAEQLDLALPLLEETLRLVKAKRGPDHPETLASMNNLAEGYRTSGRPDLALPLSEETLRLAQAKLGPEHPNTLKSIANLAAHYQDAGQFDLALELLEDTLRLQEAKLGPDHPDTLRSRHQLAEVYYDTGHRDLAQPLWEETLRLRTARLGARHPETLASMGSLAVGYWSAGRLDKSVPLFEELLTLQEKKFGRAHPSTLRTVGNLGMNYKDAGRVTDAIPLLEEAYRALTQFPSLHFGYELLDAYNKAGQPDKWAKLMDGLLTDVRQQQPSNSPQLSRLLAQFGLDLLKMEKFVEATTMLRECLAIRERNEPDAWSTFNTMSMLGEALLGQKNYAEAEPLLRKGYEEIKAREQTIPEEVQAQRLSQALDRLIELYNAMEKPGEAKIYQDLRAQYPAVRAMK